MVKNRHTLARLTVAIWLMADRLQPFPLLDEDLIARDLVDETTVMLDSTTVKVHQHGSGAKKGAIMRKLDAAGAG